MNFACLLKLWFFSWNEVFWDEYFLHYFCGYLVVYWKQSLLFLHIAFYITFIPLNILQTWCKKLTSWRMLCFLSLLTLKSWCCCDLVAAQSSAISKTRETFPWFQSAFVYFLYNVIFDFVAPDVILGIFVEFESCNWFVLKSIFWGIC